MKHASLFLLFLLLPFLSTAQNMVTNGNFEDFNTCPSTHSQASRCNGWREYHAGSTDYYNSCNTGFVGVPINGVGNQAAASGNGYMGVYTYTAVSSLYNYKEYMARTIPALIKGRAYEVSMSVSLADKSSYGTDDLGILFYDNGPSATIPGSYFVLPTPQISFSSYGVILDTAGWTRLKATFVADSAYDNIVIGGFSDYSVINLGNTTITNTLYSYYYIDSIEVLPIYNLFVQPSDTLKCAGDTMSVSYQVIPSFNIASGNTYTVQLSDAVGNFTSPYNIGTLNSTAKSGTILCNIPAGLNGTGFRVRIKSSNLADSSANNSKAISILSLSVNAGNDISICEGDTIDLLAIPNMNSLIYTWTGPGFFSTSQHHKIPSSTIAMSGKYAVLASFNGICPTTDTVNVLVKPMPASGKLVSNSPICAGTALYITPSGAQPNASFAWTGPNSYTSANDSVIISGADSSMTGFYKTTYSLNGCSATDSFKATIYRMPSPVSVTANAPICSGDTLFLNCDADDAGLLYKWSGPSFSANEKAPYRAHANESLSGKYSSTISYGTPCIQSDTVNVIIHPHPQDVAAISNTPACLGDTITLNASSSSQGVSYNWSGPSGFNAAGATTYIYDAEKKNAGTYTLTASIGDCAEQATTTIDVLNLYLDLGSNTTLCNGETMLLTASLPTATYTWQNSSTDSFFLVSSPGVYKVVATTACGILTDSISIAYQQCDCKPFIPTAFTPNGDGLNDMVHPILNCAPHSYTFIILNRFGQQVFKSNNPLQKWDGIFNGQPADVGTYFYMLKIVGPRGDNYLFKGDITLIR